MRGIFLFLLVFSLPPSVKGQLCEAVEFDQEYKEANGFMLRDYPKLLTACTELVSRYRGTHTYCEARALTLLARAKWSNGEYDLSMEMLREAKSLPGAEDAKFSSSIDDLIADNFYYQAYYDSAIKYYKSAAHTLEKAGLQHELMSTQHKLAMMYHRKGDMANALHFLYKSEELKGATPGKINDLVDFGGSTPLFNDTLYYRTKIKEELLQLATFRESGNREGEYNALLNLGIAYRQLGLHLTSARYMAKGAQVMSETGRYPLWHSAGRAYGDAGMKDSCFYFHYLAKGEAPRTTRIKNLITYEMLGDSHALFGNLDSAMWYLEHSYAVNLSMNNRISLPSVANRLARVYYRKGNKKRAEELLHVGIKQAQGTSRQHRLKLFEFGKQFYAETGDPAKALEYSNQAQALLDSMTRLEGALALVYYQAHFESVRKERELKEAQLVVRNRTTILGSVAAFTVLVMAWGATLYFQRRRIARQNKLLQASNAEQRALTQEVHHRVKNNLQYIVSLLNLQERSVTSPDLAEHIEEIKNRIMTMGLIHQRLYQMQGIQHVEVAPFVQELVVNLLNALPSQRPVTRRIQVDSFHLDVDTAISLGLLINEFVTNAVKHAFRGHSAPEISLSIVRDGAGLKMSIHDNGPGFHFPENGNGFGMKLITLLVRKLKGKVTQPDPNTVEITMEAGYLQGV